MLTEFGKMCRVIRLEFNQNLGDMAEALGMKSSFLSAVENGKKNVPKTLCEAIRAEYSLPEEHFKKLLQAAENSKTQVKIQMEGRSVSDRNLVLSFARKFDCLDATEKEQIMKILRREDR